MKYNNTEIIYSIFAELCRTVGLRAQQARYFIEKHKKLIDNKETVNCSLLGNTLIRKVIYRKSIQIIVFNNDVEVDEITNLNSKKNFEIKYPYKYNI